MTEPTRRIRTLLAAGLLPLLAAACAGRDPEARAPVEYRGTDPMAAPAAPGGSVPDARGVITYPDYAVIIARRGDTIESMAVRLGVSPAEFAAYNGLPVNWRPREGDTFVVPPGAPPAPPALSGTEIAVAPLAPDPYAPPAYVPTPLSEPAPAAPLPPLSEPAPATVPPAAPAAPGTTVWSPAIVEEAIERAPGTAADPATDPLPRLGALPGSPAVPPVSGTLPPPETVAALPPAAEPGADLTGTEPLRHVVEPGETIYSIGRLYNVPVTAIAAWNGLGRDYTLRPGQVVLIPLAAAAPPPGTATPVTPPPSAADPLPPAPPVAEIPPSPNFDQYRSDRPQAARLLAPVEYPIARPYVRSGPDRNDGVDFAAPARTPVRAADDGEVAHVSNSLGGLGKIVLIRHAGGLTTIYGRIDGLTVRKGDSVTRGQVIGVVADTANPSLHFEVRRGVESVDPAGFL